MRPVPRPLRTRGWSIARQLLVLQVLLLAALVAAGTVASVLQARGSTDEATRQRVEGIARTLADSPYVRAAAVGDDPSARLQPYAEAVRRDTGTDFVVIMAPDRTRWSHPDPARIGEAFIGRIGPALRGHTFTETYTGTLGPSVRVVTPVLDEDGAVIGLVSVGITT